MYGHWSWLLNFQLCSADKSCVRDGEFSLLICLLDYYVREVCFIRFFRHVIMNFEFCYVSWILRSALPMVNTQVAAGNIISWNFVKILIDANWHNNNAVSFFYYSLYFNDRNSELFWSLQKYHFYFPTNTLNYTNLEVKISIL